MSGAHGNEKADWFFSHAGTMSSGLPSCPCKHKHPTLELAAACGSTKAKPVRTHVREVKDNVGVADHLIDSLS